MRRIITGELVATSYRSVCYSLKGVCVIGVIVSKQVAAVATIEERTQRESHSGRNFVRLTNQISLFVRQCPVH